MHWTHALSEADGGPGLIHGRVVMDVAVAERELFVRSVREYAVSNLGLKEVDICFFSENIIVSNSGSPSHACMESK
jgi:hypothetical protein